MPPRSIQPFRLIFSFTVTLFLDSTYNISPSYAAENSELKSYTFWFFAKFTSQSTVHNCFACLTMQTHFVWNVKYFVRCFNISLLDKYRVHIWYAELCDHILFHLSALIVRMKNDENGNIAWDSISNNDDDDILENILTTIKMKRKWTIFKKSSYMNKWLFWLECRAF